MDEPDEIPEGSSKIYHARISGYILRKNKGQGFYRENFKYEMVYKDREEKDKNSHFLQCLEKLLKLKEKKKETYKITDIDKFKYLSFSVPPINGGVSISIDKETKTQWYD